MTVRLPDGYGLFVEEVGTGFPVLLLHGGPGIDHTMFRRYLDPLAEGFRLHYVDQRGQGRSERVDPASLSVERFARDVDLLAEALGLEGFALLGHSFGAIVTTWHAVNLGTAAAYVISGGGDSSEGLMADVQASLEAMGEEGAAIGQSWEREQTVATEQEFAELMDVQAPFHFAGPVPDGFMRGTVYSPDVLRYFARSGYGDFDFTAELSRVARPTLVVVGAEDRTTTPRAARALHAGIAGSELAVLAGAGHMSFVEAQSEYLDAVRRFLGRAAGRREGRGYTPRFMPEEIVEREETDIQQAPSPVGSLPDDDAWTTGPNGERIPNYEATFPHIEEGEVVHGTVVRVDKDEVLVDIGYKSEGVIPIAELSIRRSITPQDEVGVGEEVDALVLTKEDAEGRLILSKKRARFELAWKQIEDAAETGRPVIGRVIEVVKGGLILDLGVRGFLPASLVDIRRVQDLDEFLGQELNAKVIELNRTRNNVVLSRRAVLEDERKEMRQAILDRLNPGDVVEGTISNIVDFGAFVDLDGMDGLIHISELSWGHVNHPSEVLEIGQDVKVKVLDIDRDRQRISLGLKQTQLDPWQQVLETYREGELAEGKVTKVVTFGAFVEILPGVEGLVHISELAQHHVENPREIVSQGDRVRVQILEMDADRRRLSLSLKRVPEELRLEPEEPPVEGTPQIDLSEEVFKEGAGAGGPEAAAGEAAQAEPEAAEEPVSAGGAEEAMPEAQATTAEPEADAAQPAPEADAPEAETAAEPHSEQDG